MTMELPVVSTRFSGIPELVTHGLNGLLVEAGDVEELALAIAELLDRPGQRAAMGRAGRQRVLADFTIEDSARQLQTIFAACPDQSARRE
jgi:colanic acid/amylovoran biosynthesis glycosyltransferase